MTTRVFTSMLGRVVQGITGDVGADEMMLHTACGARFRFWHEQDCCEHVRIEEIVGDLHDLLGAPLVMAEEVTDYNGPNRPDEESYTWTFYKFATRKGFVTVRWFGSSNGYYSEGVTFSDD